MRVLVLFDLSRAPEPGERFSPTVLEKAEEKHTEADVIRAIRRLGHEVATLAVFDDVAPIIERIGTWKPAVVFNLVESFHADRSHEANLPALLELLNVPYTGADPQALFICKDKALSKVILAHHRVRVPRFVISHRSRPLRRLRRFGFPAFVKPAGEESSDGIARASCVKNEEEAIERARFIHEKFATDALIEEYIEGRELYLSFMGGKRITVFPPRELHFGLDDAPRFATSKVKWDENYRNKWGITNDAAHDLPAGTEKKLTHLTRRVARVLKITGPGRIDLRLTAAGEIVFLEANPNPSLAEVDDFAQSAVAAGISYDDLIRKVLDSAL